jgi:alpha-L-rhamnosidase
MNRLFGFVFSLFVLMGGSSYAQVSVSQLPEELQKKPWPAKWITVPNTPPQVYGVYHFRKTIDLPAKPSSFLVHVSGDNRYKLFVNGQLVSQGPARSDVEHWHFETVDLAPYLKQGKNSLASVVWNFAESRPFADQSIRTGFLLQGNGKGEQVVNTNESWKCIQDQAYSPINTNLQVYFVVGPGDQVDFSKYAWGWEGENFDDSRWSRAEEIRPGVMWDHRIYSEWTLTPSPVPQMEMTPQRLVSVRRAEGIKTPVDFLQKPTKFQVPANTKATLILDQSHLTTAYPVLTVSGGKASAVTVSYAESLFDGSPEKGPDSVGKGNRNEVAGKYFAGYKDIFQPDGGQQRTIVPLWWRTYRYIQLEVETKDEPLVINDFYGLYTGYPLKKTSTFTADNPELNKMLEIGWRTARLCAHETYMDCPYYEQLQYAGDVRIQTMVTMYNSPDDRLVRNAITQLRQSLSANGLTMSRYPSREDQTIPTFSLWWIGMLRDYWMYRGDSAFAQSMLPATRLVLNFFAEKQMPNGSLKRFPQWPFTDWTTSKDWDVWGSVAPTAENGNSAPLDLQLLYAYQTIAPMENAIGMKAYADVYRQRIAQLKQTIRKLYWDEARQLFADTPEKKYFSQHANILAVLTGVVEGAEARKLIENVLSDKSLVQTSIFFKYYLHIAVAQVGLGDRYLGLLDEWRSQMSRGLTTWAEKQEPTRSDCHAWGASPNIEFYRIVLGIDTDAPGFNKVVIAPKLGQLKKAGGSIPHPKGTIQVSYEMDKKGALSATISLPKDVTGTFKWKGVEKKLQGGEQVVNVKMTERNEKVVVK